MLQDLELPPDAPKFGDLSPATKTVAQPQQTAKVPDIPRIPDVTQDPVAKMPQRSTVSEDLNRELEEELKKIKQFQPAAKLDYPERGHPKRGVNQAGASARGESSGGQDPRDDSEDFRYGRVESLLGSSAVYH